MSDKQLDTKHEQPQSTEQEYFFPPDFSCKAANSAEAQKLYEQHLKGADQSA